MSNQVLQKWPLTIHYCGNEVCAPGYHFGPVVREQYLLHYCLSGQGRVFTKGQSYHISKGLGFLIRPNQMASYFADQNDPWEYAWVGFGGTSCEDILNAIGLQPSLTVFYTTDSQKSYSYIRQLLECKTLEGGQVFAIAGTFLLFLSTLGGNTQPSKVADLNDITALAINFICHNYHYDISVKDVAQAACVSKTTLYRAFKECFGISVQQYLMNLRLSTAAEMLSTTDYSINEIVCSCGFGNYQYFTRLFQSKNKITPAQYRKRFHIKNYGYDSCPNKKTGR